MNITLTFTASQQAVSDFQAAAKERLPEYEGTDYGKALIRSFVRGVIWEYRRAKRDPSADIAKELEAELPNE